MTFRLLSAVFRWLPLNGDIAVIHADLALWRVPLPMAALHGDASGDCQIILDVTVGTGLLIYSCYPVFQTKFLLCLVFSSPIPAYKSDPLPVYYVILFCYKIMSDLCSSFSDAFLLFLLCVFAAVFSDANSKVITWYGVCSLVVPTCLLVLPMSS